MKNKISNEFFKTNTNSSDNVCFIIFLWVSDRSVDRIKSGTCDRIRLNKCSSARTRKGLQREIVLKY